MSGGLGVPPPPPSGWPTAGQWPGAANAPGTWDPPTPPPRRGYRWVWALLAAFLLMVIAAISTVVWFVSAVRPPVDAMNRYLAAVERGDISASYNMLCEDARATTTRDDYARVAATFAVGLTRYNVWSFDPFGSRRTVQYDFTRMNTSSRTHRATIVREHGAWKVCSFFNESRAQA